MSTTRLAMSRSNSRSHGAYPVVTGALAALLIIVGVCSLTAEAQQAPRAYRIGVLNEAWAANHPTVEGLKAGLRELGFEEGKNVAFDVRFTEGKAEATPLAAKALVEAGVDLIFTSNEAATLAAMAATSRIPVVFTLVGDPVATGIVKKLAQPEGNLTGVSSLTTELVPKRLEALKTLIPTLRRVFAFYHGADLPSSAAIVRALEVAPRLGLELVPRTVTAPAQLDELLKQLGPGDALLAPDITTMDIPAVMLEVSLASRVPVVFSAELWVSHGGLVSYGADYRAQGIQAARLVAKIIGGTRPKDLPVEGADKIDLAVNLKTARLLGVTVPRKVLLRADVLRR
jgi:putative ABC transport system substrate-binding protein